MILLTDLDLTKLVFLTDLDIVGIYLVRVVCSGSRGLPREVYRRRRRGQRSKMISKKILKFKSSWGKNAFKNNLKERGGLRFQVRWWTGNGWEGEEGDRSMREQNARAALKDSGSCVEAQYVCCVFSEEHDARAGEGGGGGGEAGK